MSMTHTERISTEAAAYGGLIDAIGGVATIVLAIVALAGAHPETIIPITVIVFAAALLIQGGAILSEYASMIFPAGAGSASAEQFGGGGVSAVFLVGAAGIVLGVLALLDIAAATLTSVAIIAFGSALVLSANSVRHLYMMQASAGSLGAPRMGGEILAAEMASGSAGVQTLAGIAAIVLGLLAVAGHNSNVLIASALIVLGATVILTGSTLGGLVMGFMRETTTRSVGTP
jgi:hypothetical protein